MTWRSKPGASRLTRSPSQKKIPLATGREGVLCSDTVRMIPKQMWMIPVKMWMVWGKDGGERSTRSLGLAASTGEGRVSPQP